MSVLITPLDDAEISKWMHVIINEQIKPLDISQVLKSDLTMLANLYAFLNIVHTKRPTKVEDIIDEPRVILSYEERDEYDLDLYIMLTVGMDGIIDYLTVTWTAYPDYNRANIWTERTVRREHTKGRPQWQKHQQSRTCFISSKQ